MNNSNQNWKRRDILKSLGAAAVGVPLAKSTFAENSADSIEIPFKKKTENDFKKPVKVIVIGAGGRGWGAYSSYGLKFPKEFQVVGVAEPIPYRRERISKAYNIPKENQFVTWEHVFEVPKFADALVIATPDDLHYGPAMAGLEMGYDLLLEKVIAQTWEECNDILKLTEKKNAIVAVCHVLRYNAYF
ncbi:MAG: Gfo/Idh/MocA family oxidoreductase, partial [Draconibacterium sp.]|nr:Gfo/Idh/MocA family oxidoreductase [Draconibacterium sp.]